MKAPENLWIQPNIKCWYMKSSSSDDPYLPSTITQKIGDKLNLRTKSGELIANVVFSSVFQRGDNLDLIDDMVDIEFLNEAELLNNLKRRFLEKSIIFTYVGPTLLIINPYKYINELFDVDTMALYQKQIHNNSFTLKDLPPHIFGITADLFKNIFLNQRNQALVISGESGAGKTENTKFAMKFLTSLGNIMESKDSAAIDMFKSNNLKKRLSIKKIAIEEKILSCNPILEAFGNAKTVRNDNSSRFGKYVTLLVNKETKKIVGALIYNYLLEKSRIPNPAKSERNYHIFYHLLRGGDEQTLENLGLKNKKVADFKYLSVSGCEEVKTVDDSALFIEVSESFKTMHFMKEDVDSIWRIVAGVMMLGNVDFDDAKKDDTHACSLINEEEFLKIVKLLKIDGNQLRNGLTLKTILVANQTINSPMTKDDCRFARDSLAKDLYNRLFIWLVTRLNENIIPLQDLDNTLDRQIIEASRYSIGLLDIFGFECFTFNSFEQLCINFTNEKLQQLYISYVFKSEEQEFIKEGLKDYLCELNFKDNQDIIDLLEKYPAGIFNLLDESCAIAGDDAKLLGKIRTTHKGNTCFIIPKLAKDCFTVIHTAKDVEYNINGFREKNKDDISRSISSVLEASSLSLLSSFYKIMFEEPPDNHKKTSSQKFLSGKFRFQMKNLMNELESCQCHFIRCLKPNDQKKKEFWMGTLVLQQIQYLGVLQSIKVRKESYPIRRNYKNFYERFSELSDNKKSLIQLEQDPKTDYKSLIERIMKEKFKNLNKELVLFGTTKIFLRSSAFEMIERQYKETIKIKEEKAIKIQKAYFRYMQMKNLRRLFKGLKIMQNLWKVRTEHKKFLKIKKSVRIIQKFWREIMLRKNNEKVRKNCVFIQNYFRRYIDYVRFGVRRMRSSVILIQIFWRRMMKLKQRKLFEEIKKITRTIVDNAYKIIINKKAAKIQKLMRGHLCRKLHKKEIFTFKEKTKIWIQNQKAIIIQANIRCFIRRKAYKRLKYAANYIKAFFKSIWCSRRYQEMKQACIKLQKAIRPYLVQRKIINNRLKEYFEELDDDNLGFLRESEPSFFYNYNNSYRKCDYLKETTPFDNKGIELFTLIFDFDILMDYSIIYGQSWSNTFRSLYLAHPQILSINFGSTHTFISNSKENSFSWGWNDRSQQTKGGRIKIPRNIKMISCGEDYCFLLNERGELLFFGENNAKWFNLNENVNEITPVQIKDFLIEEVPIENIGTKNRKPSPDRMLGNKQDCEYLALKKQKILKNLKFRQVASKSLFSLLLSDSGEVFYFSALASLPKNYFFPVAIVQVSCSYNFSVLLTNAGQVFTFGVDNDEGELGLGDYLGRDKPTFVEGLKKEKIIEIDCGFKHVIVRSLANNIWLWGSNRKLQLALPLHFKNCCTPTLLDGKQWQNSKLIQICAGFSSSIILTQNWKAFWWGSNHSLKKQQIPLEIFFEQKFLEMKGKLGSEFLVIRLLSSWNKHLSIFYCTVADMRNFKGNNNLFKHKILESLVKRWGEAGLKSINPPFVESIANYFGSKTMKIHTNGEKIKKNDRKNIEEPDEKDSQEDEEEIEEASKLEKKDESSDLQSENSSFLQDKELLIEKTERQEDKIDEEFSFDRSNNFHSNRNIPKNMDSSSKKDGYSSLNDRASDSMKKEELPQLNMEKLREIKNRLVILLKIPKEKWTPTDIQFISLAFEPKMRELLSKI